MQIYKCDFCGKVKPCKQVEIDGKEFDLCSNCKGELDGKLKGKGRVKPATITIDPKPFQPYEPYRPWQPYWITTTTDIPARTIWHGTHTDHTGQSGTSFTIPNYSTTKLQ